MQARILAIAATLAVMGCKFYDDADPPPVISDAGQGAPDRIVVSSDGLIGLPGTGGGGAGGMAGEGGAPGARDGNADPSESDAVHGDTAGGTGDGGDAGPVDGAAQPGDGGVAGETGVTCDPYRQTCPSLAQACYPTATGSFCAPAGGAGAGAPCAENELCDRGLWCAAVLGQGGMFCRPICDPELGCAGGERCIKNAGSSVGYCAP